MPSIPMALTRSSTERVEMPWMLSIRFAAQPWITAVSASSAMRRGSRGKVGAASQLRDPELDRPGPRSQSRSR